ncbi:MAG: DEAD/DEAH box helicase [Candidatus Delongbacteria bacterium]|nr:DEAD/DEAH box helicase [Candidatus Delongbacteria bacterium]
MAATPVSTYLARVKKRNPGYEVLFQKRLTPVAPRFGDLPLSEPLRAMLDHLGVEQLYSHQTEALAQFRTGRDLIISTPTASGKTLTYTLPLLELLEQDPEARALLMFPLKSLAQDQLRWFNRVAAAPGSELTAAIYDGDTTPHRRRSIKAKQPNLLLTNPDMLHYTLLPQHPSWQKFFQNLQLVILDEVHVYRGVFGAHVMHIIKRLLRIASYYGASPRFLLSSATVANVQELGESLLGREVTVIDRSGGATPEKQFLFINPAEDKPFYRVSLELFLEAIKSGIRTILFTQSRRLTEALYANIRRFHKPLAPRVAAYRAGFRAQERREIEERLKEGELLGVITTSALELGIDIGGLDLCILAGYPGTLISTWQRAGRVGRAGVPALVLLVAGDDALDQYFMREPETLFEQSFERAIIGSDNRIIRRDHLVCAAAELALTPDDPQYPTGEFSTDLQQLRENGRLDEVAGGKQYFPVNQRPQQEVQIRAIGESYSIHHWRTGKLIGTVSGGQAFSECHTGAVYLHQGRQYLIEELDLGTHKISARPVDVNFYTQPLSEKEIRVLEVERDQEWHALQVYEGELEVKTQITGFQKRDMRSRELISTHQLEGLPPLEFQTRGIWLRIPPQLEQELVEAEEHFMGSLHAIEHASLALTPLFALCDRNDVGGICFTHHEDVDDAAIFFYDGYPGGIGIFNKLYGLLDQWLPRVRQLIAECDCTEGCPSCVHSPKCGSGNRPLSKTGAVQLLDRALELTAQPVKPVKTRKRATSRKPVVPQLPPLSDSELTQLWGDRKILVFDLETRFSAAEVGGWHNAHRMRISVAVTLDVVTGEYCAWEEEQVDQLLEELMAADIVVGFNSERFDFNVLKGYLPFALKIRQSLDLLKQLRRSSGRSAGLNALASATLKLGKSADGLQALEWWREGKIDQIRAYCQKDVEVTWRLFEHAVRHGWLYLPGAGGEPERVNIDLRTELASGNLEEPAAPLEAKPVETSSGQD